MTAEDTPDGAGFAAVENVTLTTHNGTHLDAPWHFLPTMYLTSRGVRVTGSDAWSWDAPFVHTAERVKEVGDTSLIWKGHKAGRDIGYCHLEKVHNLEVLLHGVPLPTQDSLRIGGVDPRGCNLRGLRAGSPDTAIGAMGAMRNRICVCW